MTVDRRSVGKLRKAERKVELKDEATIYRDTWGVPHIYGESERAAIFAQGYSQAEDRLPTIFKAYRKATGTMAEAFGPEWVEHDYLQRMLGHLEVSRRRFPELSSPCRRMIKSFISGVKAFTEEFPKRVPEWSCQLEPEGIVTLSWFIVARWQLDEAWGKLERAGRPELESNEWALGRSRTKEGVPMACIDPHVSWQDEWLFHEVHLHGGGLHVFGFSPVGVPYVSLGHNRHFSWAMTTGGPDTSDVYQEELSPDGSKYLYDGEWREVQRTTTRIAVRKATSREVVERDIRRTHHGPIVRTRGKTGFAIKMSLHDQVHLVEEIRAINRARDLGGFLEALSMLQLMPQNVMYADTRGNIYYQRTGRVPRRPKGFDWKKPVPGNTSATEWMGIHPMEDLVQILNPPAGFMQNCNISPGTMTSKSPATADRYPDYIYNTSTKRSNPRGKRFLEIIRRKKTLDLDEALDVMVDIKLHGTEPLRRRLREAYSRRKGEFPELAHAVEIITSWDGVTDVRSIGMTLFTFWERELAFLRKSRTGNAERNGAEREDRVLLEALQKALEYIETKFGGIEIEWGRVQRGKRGDRSWPLAGCNRTLRAIGTERPDGSGILYANRGQSCPTLVVLGTPIRSFSAVPYGQSEDPESPHFTDQGERLFSRRRLKPTWTSKVELLQNLESVTQVFAPQDEGPI